MLQLPVLGPIARKFSTSQAARTLATLLGGGIPLVNAIDVAARSIKNRYIARELQTAGAAGARRPRAGGGDERKRRVPRRRDQDGGGRRVDRRAAGDAEQPGRLLRRGDRHQPGRFITLVEPTLLVIMGIVIAGLLLSLYMPLFNMGGLS